MKTEKEYADELVNQYMALLAPCDGIGDDWIQCAINDVTNTIKALDRLGICDTSYYSYYQTVLQILKERLWHQYKQILKY